MAGKIINVSELSQTERDLIKAALEVKENAHQPYSKFNVGSALISETKAVHKGCNVENFAYSLSTCAERTAICKAVSERTTTISTIAVITNAEDFTAPCGSCRQVIYEFGGEKNCTVIMAKYPGDTQCLKISIEDLLPYAFGPRPLKVIPNLGQLVKCCELNDSERKAFDAALQVKLNAHCPYSKIKAGAAVVGGSGKIYKGCSVENAAYPLSSCAESTAVCSAISEGEKTITVIALASDEEFGRLSGGCRQVVYEFGHKTNCTVLMVKNSGDECIRITIKELLPYAFGPEDLDKPRPGLLPNERS